jgi:hypothetical protein
VLGVRGDKQRSVECSRRAVAISPTRLDYHVELGAGLLCLGTKEQRAELVREGLAVLRHSQTLVPFPEVRLDRSYARPPDRAARARLLLHARRLDRDRRRRRPSGPR